MDNQLLNQSTNESTQSVQPQPFVLDGGDHQIDPNHQDSDIRPDIRPGRQRVKRACQPCKSRKKRCDGSEPCATCIRYGYECHYELGPRKRRRHTLKDHDTDVSQSHSSPDTSVHHRDEKERAESDSGHVSQPGVKDTNLWGKAFATSLALKLDAGKLSKPHLAWNLGLKDEQTYAQPAITRVIDQVEMERLANYYFDTTHQIFGIFKRDLVERKIVERWGINFNNSDPHDPILCGIAALGSLFSGGNPSPAEASLVELAKMALETTSVLNYPSRHHVVAWVLRTLFLRCTACPHAAWLASCTTMHIIESVGMEDDSDTTSSDAELERGTPVGCGVLNMQRLFWIARLMNSWVANDYGRSKVTLKIPTPSFPLPEGEVDVTLDYLTLFQISERLDQDVSHTAVEFEAGIAAIYAFHARSDGAILSQTNLCLGLYRRLRLLASSISQEAVDQVISVCTKGLGAVMRMVERRQPWWHVGNIPFQFVCVLLAMDTPEALSHIGEALETLDAVSRCFTTRSLTESAATARTLVELSQKRKLEEINILGQGLKTRIDPTMASSQLQIPVMNGKQMMPSSTVLGNGSGHNMMSGMTNIGSMDFTGFDWDSFLSMDIPVLDATAIL
ncbi:hypothetical protein MFRU_044g00030 [Monilinia fructicola]|uniref:Zn(2)-C6 fungal-type domain-containing protein n=1 Tax=Monilinia fructicola TaxID=38448 RepID=A0A5M9JAM3_MONFR|nr:hypothetical protein EYC84_009196 [Monilinia fructicola]KAG4026132.1 hypothetical protein MFRU_044g00030 [Monilinia fructicola]